MEVEYHLTFDDLLAFERHARKQAARIIPPKLTGPWVLALVLTSGVGGSAVWVAEHRLGAANLRAPFLVGMLVGALVMGLCSVALARGRRRSVRELFEEGPARWTLAPRQLTISPDGFRVVNFYVDGMNRWAQVWKIVVTDDHVFFYITPFQGHVVPRRAFASRQDFDAFVGLARQYHEGRVPFPVGFPRSEGITTSPTPPVADILPHDIP